MHGRVVPNIAVVICIYSMIVLHIVVVETGMSSVFTVLPSG